MSAGGAAWSVVLCYGGPSQCTRPLWSAQMETGGLCEHLVYGFPQNKLLV